MTRGPLDYGQMMQRALRGVMADALGVVAEHGLPGSHHFYITFETDHPGVDMPGWLRDKHPEEITIVIQHEWDNLVVTPDRFSVDLSFSDRLATLVVPLDAVKTFVDPSVEFGLKFTAVSHDEDEEFEEETHEGEPEIDWGESDDDDEGKDEGAAKRRGEVVSLDNFRKH